MNINNKKKISALLVATAIGMYANSASAINLSSSDTHNLNLDIEAVVGAFSSDENYSPAAASSPRWQEVSLKYGLSGDYLLDDDKQLFGKLNLVTSANWGDGDAGGLTTGDERNTDLEEVFIGIRSDAISLSIGRQILKIGDGFILNDDGLNMGTGIDPELKRAGAYYIAPHKATDQTLLLSLGGDTGFRSDLFWFKSDNKAQGRPTMAGVNLEHVSEHGTFGFLHLKGLDTDPTGILGGAFDNLQRDGQKTTSVRYQGNAGIENLFLSAEFVHQQQGNNSSDANAWYTEAGWTFAETTWSPTLKYRYSSFDNGYDQLFTGFNVERDYGTWFQGEVHADYAAGGPFNTDVDVHMLGVTAMPREDLSVGALYFDFNNTRNGSGGNDANEVNLFATWFASENMIITPLLGFYTPKNATSVQGNTNTNTYAQVQAIFMF